MSEAAHHLGILRELTWSHVLLVLAVLIGCRLLVGIVRWLVRRAAESAPSHRRLLILRTAPKRTIERALNTGDFKEAQKRRHTALANIHADFDRARRSTAPWYAKPILTIFPAVRLDRALGLRRNGTDQFIADYWTFSAGFRHSDDGRGASMRSRRTRHWRPVCARARRRQHSRHDPSGSKWSSAGPL